MRSNTSILIWRKTWLIWVIPLLFSSCLSNKRLVYLQDKSEKNSHLVFKDAEFSLTPPAHLLKEDDVLYVEINRVGLQSLDLPLENKITSSPTFQQPHPYINGFIINKDGQINLPVIGAIEVRGLTLDEARLKIEQSALPFYTEPNVRLVLLNFNISVLGEVLKPGRYPVYTGRITVLEAIAMAGGMTDYGNRAVVKLVRQTEGTQKVIHLDLNDQNTLSREVLFMENNDILIISPMRRKAFAERTAQWVLSAVTTSVAVISLILTVNR